MTTVMTFHKDPALKGLLLARIGAHEDADAIARGAYERWNGTVKRCAVGCSLRDLAECGPEPPDWHAEMEEVLGIPSWLASLEDRVFEGMADEIAKGWPRRFSEAVPVGVDLDGLADRLAVRRLREECLPLSGTWPESIRAQVVAAIEQTIAALEGKSAAAAAESAAAAAESAAESAAAAAWSAAAAVESAAWSAAESAAWSAAAAAWSAAAAAESAAWSAAEAAFAREGERIIAELEAWPHAN